MRWGIIGGFAQPSRRIASESMSEPKSPSPAKDAARQLLKQLQERFPVLKDARPMAIGIDAEILTALPEIEKKTLRTALRMHTGTTRYLKSMARGEKRFNLAGEPVATIGSGGIFLRLAVALLDAARELGAATLDDVEVVIGQLAPLGLHLALELLPVSFNLIPVHNYLLGFTFLFHFQGLAPRLRDKCAAEPRVP